MGGDAGAPPSATTFTFTNESSKACLSYHGREVPVRMLELRWWDLLQHLRWPLGLPFGWWMPIRLLVEPWGRCVLRSWQGPGQGLRWHQDSRGDLLLRLSDCLRRCGQKTHNYHSYRALWSISDEADHQMSIQSNVHVSATSAVIIFYSK